MGHLAPQGTRAPQETLACKVPQAFKDLLGLRERRDNQVHRATEVKLVQPEIRAQQGQQDHREPLEMWVRRVPLDLRDRSGHKDHRDQAGPLGRQEMLDLRGRPVSVGLPGRVDHRAVLGLRVKKACLGVREQMAPRDKLGQLDQLETRDYLEMLVYLDQMEIQDRQEFKVSTLAKK